MKTLARYINFQRLRVTVNSVVHFEMPAEDKIGPEIGEYVVARQ